MLTEKQKRFADEYLKDLNAAQAAIRTGYSEKTAKEQASRLLTNVNLQAYIASKREKLEKKTEITQEWVLNNLKKVFERCMEEEAVLDKEGNFTGVFEFAHSGATKSLELLGKHLGLFADRLKVGGDEKGIPIEIKKQSTLNQINDRIKQMLGRE